MKKILATISMVFGVLFLVSCSLGSPSNTGDRSSDKSLETDEYKFNSSNAYLAAIAIDAAWDLDKDLNKNLKYVSIDTDTFMDFSKDDTAELFNYISKKYNVIPLDMNMDELEEAGYVKDGEFVNGIVYDVSSYKEYSKNSVSFRGRKRRSNLGAIGFTFEAIKVKEKWVVIKSSVNWIY